MKPLALKDAYGVPDGDTITYHVIPMNPNGAPHHAGLTYQTNHFPTWLSFLGKAGLYHLQPKFLVPGCLWETFGNTFPHPS